MANNSSNNSAPQKMIIDISSLAIIKLLLVVILVATFFYLRDIALMVFVSLILASAIDPWVDWLEKYQVPRPLSVFLIYSVAILLLTVSALLLVNPIAFEIKRLAQNFPAYWEQASGSWRQIEDLSDQYGFKENIINFLQNIQVGLNSNAGNLFGTVASFFGGIFSLILVLVITFYLSVYDIRMKRKIRSFLPIKYQPYFTHLVNRIQEKIGLWLRGQLLLSVIIFALSLIGLSVLGVEYAWVLALFAGITEFIPYLGPFIGAVPAIFIAFVQSPVLGLAVLILYIIIQQLENYLIVPQVMKRAVGLNPVVIIVAMLIGAKFAGIVGIILSIPVTTAIGLALGDIFTHSKTDFSTINIDEKN